MDVAAAVRGHERMAWHARRLHRPLGRDPPAEHLEPGELIFVLRYRRGGRGRRRPYGEAEEGEEEADKAGFLEHVVRVRAPAAPSEGMRRRRCDPPSARAVGAARGRTADGPRGKGDSRGACLAESSVARQPGARTNRAQRSLQPLISMRATGWMLTWRCVAARLTNLWGVPAGTTTMSPAPASSCARRR